MRTAGSWRQLLSCSGEGGVLPDFRQSAADCCVSWARADAIPKWRDGPRPADQSCRQQSRTQDHGPARLAMVALSAGERLAQWFRGRVGELKGRTRRIAIVAMARKLLIAIWRFITVGIVPEGAILAA